MKIFLAGGTGVVGTRALPALVAAGHDVTAVARTDAKADLVRSLGGEPVTVDLFDAAGRGRRRRRPRGGRQPGHEHPAADQGGAGLGLDHQRAAAQRGLEPPGGRGPRTAGAARYVQESIAFPYVDNGDRVDRRGPPGRPGRAVHRCPRRRGGGGPLRRARAVRASCSGSPSSTPRTAATRRRSTPPPGGGSTRSSAPPTATRPSSTPRTPGRPWSRRCGRRAAPTTWSTTSPSPAPRRVASWPRRSA